MAKILNLSIGSLMFVHVDTMMFGWNIRWFSRMDNDGFIWFSIRYPFKASFGLPRRWIMFDNTSSRWWLNKDVWLFTHIYLETLGFHDPIWQMGGDPNANLVCLWIVIVIVILVVMEFCGNRANDNLRKLINVSTTMFWKKYDDSYDFWLLWPFLGNRNTLKQQVCSTRFLFHTELSLRLLGRRRWRPAERLRSWEV